MRKAGKSSRTTERKPASRAGSRRLAGNVRKTRDKTSDKTSKPDKTKPASTARIQAARKSDNGTELERAAAALLGNPPDGGKAPVEESMRLEEEVSRLREKVLLDRPHVEDRKMTAADFEALFQPSGESSASGDGVPKPADSVDSAGPGTAEKTAEASEDSSPADPPLRLWDDWPAVGESGPENGDAKQGGGGRREHAVLEEIVDPYDGVAAGGDGAGTDRRTTDEAPWDETPWRDQAAGNPSSSLHDQLTSERFPEFRMRPPPASRRVPPKERPRAATGAGAAARKRQQRRGKHPRLPAGSPGLVYVASGSGPINGNSTLRVYNRHEPPRNEFAWGRRGNSAPAAEISPVPIDKNLTRRSQHPLDHRIASVLLRLPRQAASSRPRQGKKESRKKGKGPANRKSDPCVLTVTEKAWRTLLPWLLETKRFYLAPPGSLEAVPVVQDEQPSLEFNLLLERIPRRGDYHLTCRFVRDKRTLLYKSQVLLITEGEKGFLLRRSGKLSSVEFAGSVAWLRALRRGRFRHVPRKKVPSLLKIFERSTTLPPIHFPGSLKIRKIDGLEPRPELKLESGPQEVTGEVTFRYGEDIVRAARPGKRFFSMKNRRLIVRNLEEEAAHAVNLLKQGFAYDQATHTFSLSADRLAAAAPELFELGWTLHGKKMPFRPPTDMDVNVTTGPDYIDVEVTVHFGDQNVDVMTLLEAIKQGNRMIPLKQGAVGVLPGEWLEKNAAWLELGQPHDGKLRFRRQQSAVIDALVAERIQARLDEGFRAERKRLATFEGIHDADASEAFKGTLRAYQKFGLGWLLFLDKMGWGGCLADDMGLGKTIQALALLQLLKEQGREGTTLIVTPKSLTFNWLRESARFTPELKVASYTGAKRAAILESISDYDIVFTTYGTVRRDAEKLSESRFFYLILDEAQAIKNAESQNAKAISLLQGDRKLILSGTPVENHLGELWSLFNFLNPGMLGKYGNFKKRFGGDRLLDSASAGFLRRTLRPFILRRKKEEVTPDLPEKIEETILCEMDADQREVYQKVKERCRNSVLAQVKAKGLARSKLHILEALLRMRQAACHPALVSDDHSDVSSGKINAFLSMLEEVEDAGHKVLIFSQFTSLLAIVRKEMDARGKVYEYLDGQTRDRGNRVDRFQEDEKCRFFLISLKAGGLGLNLTAADYVFILDPWWNPAVEAQAIDRAHRIGQDKKVFAYRFVSKDSIEERIMDLQDSKRKLADAIVAADENLIRTLTKHDLEALFK